MNKMTIRDIPAQGKKLLVRVDFNVPLDKATSAVADDTRLRAALPTIEYLRQRGDRVILCSHLGRPDGKVVEGLRLAPVAARLAQLLGAPVATAPDCVGPLAEAAVARLAPGEVLLLENLRFHPVEEANDPLFARALARLADIFVNDAFGTAHRAHASTVGVARLLPAVAGFLMEKEIDYLSRALEKPERPFAAILGGAKVSTKMGVLENLVGKVDKLLLGGGMANTFLKAQGYPVGDSLVEEDRLDYARDIIGRAGLRGVPLPLPLDVVVAQGFRADAPRRTVPARRVPRGWVIMDLGPQTIRSFKEELSPCRTVLWNGPVGVSEFARFAQGTQELARALAELKATVIVGGGETAAAVEELGLAGKFSHVSTGGGATLEFLEGKELPGVAALRDKT